MTVGLGYSGGFFSRYPRNDPYASGEDTWARLSRRHYYGSRLRAWWSCFLEWFNG